MNLDNDFIELLHEVLEADEVYDLISAIELGECAKSIRINDAKYCGSLLLGDRVPSRRSYDPRFCTDDLNAISTVNNLSKNDSIPWCEYGRYIPSPQSIRFVDDVAFHGGGYYVQEASSMFLWRVLNEKVAKDAKILDACAAPGGKSTLISQYLNGDGFLVSNEYVARRSNVLIENLTKWGRDNWLVTNDGLEKYEFLGELFDVVLVDAPCSGEGMFRKDEESIEEWSLNNVLMCQARQREIVRSAWKTLKNNGIMIYSTCTYNAIENERNVEWIENELGGVVENVTFDDTWGICIANTGGYHFYPHKVRGEGLFMSIIRKNEVKVCPRRMMHCTSVKWEKKLTPDWLKCSDEYSILSMKDAFWAVKKSFSELVERIFSAGLNVRACGVEYGIIRGRGEIVPASGLAMSLALDHSKFQVLSLDRDEAMKYLRCETVSIGDTVRGMVLVESQGYALGWAKNVGNRCNNLYPTYWRIRN